jgi:hypothetical protein
MTFHALLLCLSLLYLLIPVSGILHVVVAFVYFIRIYSVSFVITFKLGVALPKIVLLYANAETMAALT